MARKFYANDVETEAADGTSLGTERNVKLKFSNRASGTRPDGFKSDKLATM